MTYFLSILYAILFAAAAQADERALINDIISDYYTIHIAPTVMNPDVLEDVILSNAHFTDYSRKDFLALNNKWLKAINSAESPFIKNMLNNEISQKLSRILESGEGTIVNIRIINQYAVSVGQTHISKNLWHAEDLILHSLLKRRNLPQQHISQVRLSDDGHYFYIRAYFPQFVAGTRFVTVVDFNAEEIDYIRHVQEQAH